MGRRNYSYIVGKLLNDVLRVALAEELAEDESAPDNEANGLPADDCDASRVVEAAIVLVGGTVAANELKTEADCGNDFVSPMVAVLDGKVVCEAVIVPLDESEGETLSKISCDAVGELEMLTDGSDGIDGDCLCDGEIASVELSATEDVWVCRFDTQNMQA